MFGTRRSLETFTSWFSLQLSSLTKIQEQIHQLEMNDTVKDHEIKAQHELEKALAKEELFWMEKARIICHKHGDRNTSYFHRVCKIKSSKNKITNLRDEDNMITDPDEMAAHPVNYFTNIFGFAGEVQRF